MPVAVGQALTDRLNYNLTHRETSTQFDLLQGIEDVLSSVGASTKETGGNFTFYGSDPIVPAVMRYGSMAAIALTAKSAQVASIWKLKTGESQDIHTDVRKALRRFSPFIDNRWERVNGYTGGLWEDPDDALGGSIMYQTKDGKWVAPTDFYPKLHNYAEDFIDEPNNPVKVAAAIKKWDGVPFEEACAANGLVMPLGRPLEEVMTLDVYTKALRDMPLITIEKIGESEPKPFPKTDTPLGGLRALGMAHVIAGPSIGRALALHGADVLNIWRPSDWEHNVFYYTSHVGMRSSVLDIDEQVARKKFNELLSTADVFFANRRPYWYDRHNLTSEEIHALNPGIVEARVVYATLEGQPWGDRVGFDFSTGMAMGIFNLEGTNEHPQPPPVIHVINDYVSGWLTTVGVLQALKRRAVEGGSYRVLVSLSRVSLWLMSLGMFEKQFSQAIAGSDEEHLYVPPDLFTAPTTLGIYTGLTEQIVMSKTPGAYKHVLVPRCSSQPEWETV